MKTIDEAKTYLRENWEKGVDCPCCGQLVKRYQYPINSSIATTLISMFQLHYAGHNWVHVNTQIRPTSGGYFSLAQKWGLIVGDKNDDSKKRVSGRWALTQKGIDFVTGKILVPKYVYSYDKRTLDFSDEHITIQEALGKEFDYTELMGEYLDKNIEQQRLV